MQQDDNANKSNQASSDSASSSASGKRAAAKKVSAKKAKPGKTFEQSQPQRAPAEKQQQADKQQQTEKRHRTQVSHQWNARGFEWRPGRFLPWHELQFSADTSGGPGGQHANRSQTRISLKWRLKTTTAFAQNEIDMLRNFLHSQLSRNGEIRIRCGTERSAQRNRQICLERLAASLNEAIKARKPRLKSKPSKSSKKRRLDQKGRRSKVKQDRQKPKFD